VAIRSQRNKAEAPFDKRGELSPEEARWCASWEAFKQRAIHGKANKFGENKGMHGAVHRYDDGSVTEGNKWYPYGWKPGMYIPPDAEKYIMGNKPKFARKKKSDIGTNMNSSQTPFVRKPKYPNIARNQKTVPNKIDFTKHRDIFFNE
jgi:hypothetical protein